MNRRIKMRTSRRWMVLMAGAAAWLAACDTSMMDNPAAMRDHIQAARVENQAHVDAAALAASMTEMMAEMDRHGPRMDGMMDAMGGTMDAMMGCTGAGMQGMMNMRGQMMGEMDDHAAAMAGETQLDTARGEVDRHTAAMAAMLDQMGAALGDVDCGGMH
jgi:hypothetical protein